MHAPTGANGSRSAGPPGTTGRPKGVVRPLQDAKVYKAYRAADTIQECWFNTETIYLCPAPLYHAAPCWPISTAGSRAT